MSDDVERPAILYTPIPMVWGTDGRHQAWWSVNDDRMVVFTPELTVPEAGIHYELWTGGLCEQHGLEGEIVGMTMDLNAAFAWACGGNMPFGGLVN